MTELAKESLGNCRGLLRSWAWATQLAEAEGEEAQSTSVGRFRHSSHKLLSAIQLSTALRGGAAGLRVALINTLALVCPPILVGALTRGFQKDAVVRTVPSSTTIRRNELALDIAMMLQRRLEYPQNMVRWAWADSSEVAGHDWYWSQFHELPQDQLTATVRAAHDLAAAVQAHVVAQVLTDHGRAGAKFRDPLPAWRPMLDQLAKIHEHIPPPSALGSGHKGVPHKVGAQLFQWHLELPSNVSLEDFAASFASFTSDLGAEASLPNFHCKNMEEMLPPWVDRSLVRLDVDDVGAPLEEPARAATDTVTFLPNALSIYGLQHAIFNLNKDVHTCLQYCNEFWPQIKNFEALFAKNQGDRRRRFTWTCMMGSPLQGHIHKLQRWTASLYEPRWKEVANFLKHLCPILYIFRCEFLAMCF